MLANQTGTMEQFFGEHLYRLEFKRVLIVNNRRVRGAFFANQRGHFLAPAFGSL